MLAKLYNGLAITAIATVLAVGGLLGFLGGSGRLTAQRVEKIAAVLRGELDEPEAGQEEPDQPAPEGESSQPAVRSAEQIRRTLVSEQLRRAALERMARDVAARQELLDHALQVLLVQQEKLEEEQAAWAERKRQALQALQAEGFQRELRLVNKLAPKLAKEHLIRTWKERKADAVRLLTALKESRAQRILDQFKTPEEMQIMHELLEQLRAEQTNELAAGSGMTSGDAGP